MRHENTPRALWEAIIANAVFGALVFLRGSATGSSLFRTIK
jgi:hypothetical protein